jgi:hypothetical protein
VTFDKSFVVIFLAIASSFPGIPALNADEPTPFPLLTHAELPLYPQDARLAHIAGTVELRVVIEKGSVVNTEVKSVTISSCICPSLTEELKNRIGLYLSEPSLENVKTWKFQSLERKKLTVKYDYLIQGEPSATVENPKVEFNLPAVTITTTPAKPMCFDCGAHLGGKHTQ